MGFWDAVSYTSDLLKGITPDMSTVKRAGDEAYRCTSSTVTKIDQVVRDRADAIQKLPDQYRPDDETIAQLGLFTTTLVKNSHSYAMNEGYKHLPGAPVVKLVLDSMNEVKQESNKDNMKSREAKIDKWETSTSQPQSLIQSEKTTDIINTFFITEFVGNQMFRNLMVHNDKITRIENPKE